MTSQRNEPAQQRRAAPAPVAVLAACMVAVAVGLDLAPIVPYEHFDLSVVAWALILCLLFWLVEVVPIHFEWAGQAYSMSLSEVPLVLGMFFCQSPIFLLARVAAVAWHSLCPGGSRRTSSRSTWRCSRSRRAWRSRSSWARPGTVQRAPWPLRRRRCSRSRRRRSRACSPCLRRRTAERRSVRPGVLKSFLRTGTFAIAVNTSIALVLTTAMRGNLLVVLPMVVMLSAGGGVYRAYVTLRQRHSGLEMLYEFTSGLNKTDDVGPAHAGHPAANAPDAARRRQRPAADRQHSHRAAAACAGSPRTAGCTPSGSSRRRASGRSTGSSATARSC